MPDLLIRDIDPELKRQIEERAQRHDRNLEDEAKALIKKGLDVVEPELGMGTWMCNLVPPEYRGDDLDFEIPGQVSPPDFE